MKSILAGRKLDSVDLAAVAVMVLAAVFVSVFFWNASAGARGGEESFLEELQRAAGKRMKKEQAVIGFLLDLGGEGKTEQLLEEGEKAAVRLAGNSQFHLLMARSYRQSGALADSVAAYRKALEKNRDFSDRRSPLYVGSSLRPFIREVRLARAGSPGFKDSGMRRDLFYLERSLAGGCH